MSNTVLSARRLFFDGLIELHVDDGHGCGKETVIAELLTFLAEKIEMEIVQRIWCGSHENLKIMKVRDDQKQTNIPNKMPLQSAMLKMGMSECKGNFSPKLDKPSMEDDNEEMDEEQTWKFRFSVLALLHLSDERTDIQNTVQFLCTKLKGPTALEMRQLKKLLRYVQGTEDMATIFGCVMKATRRNSSSRNWKSSQTPTGQVTKRRK